MPKFKLGFNVYCTCGHQLTAKVPTTVYSSTAQVDVEPCENCQKKAHIAGYEECEYDNDLQ